MARRLRPYFQGHEGIIKSDYSIHSFEEALFNKSDGGMVGGVVRVPYTL